MRLKTMTSFVGPGGLATPDDIEAYEAVQRGVSATGDTARFNDWSDMSRGMERRPARSEWAIDRRRRDAQLLAALEQARGRDRRRQRKGRIMTAATELDVAPDVTGHPRRRRGVLLRRGDAARRVAARRLARRFVPGASSVPTTDSAAWDPRPQASSSSTTGTCSTRGSNGSRAARRTRRTRIRVRTGWSPTSGSSGVTARSCG